MTSINAINSYLCFVVLESNGEIPGGLPCLIGNCSLGSTQSLILINQLRKVSAILYGLRRRTGETSDIYGVVCHRYGLVEVVSVGHFHVAFWMKEAG